MCLSFSVNLGRMQEDRVKDVTANDQGTRGREIEADEETEKFL